MADTYKGKNEDGNDEWEKPDGRIIVKDRKKKGKDAWSYKENNGGGGGGNSGCLGTLVFGIIAIAGIIFISRIVI